MVFSSESHLRLFAGVFFALLFDCGSTKKLADPGSELIFYSVGAGSTVLVLLVSIWINQFLAIKIEPAHAGRRRALLAIGIAVNLSRSWLLQVRKLSFGSFPGICRRNCRPSFSFPPAPRSRCRSGFRFSPFRPFPISSTYIGKKFLPPAATANSSTYHSLFPQLMAGPIVRYREIKLEMRQRVIDLAASD